MQLSEVRPLSRAGRELLLVVLRGRATSQDCTTIDGATPHTIADMMAWARQHRVLGLLGPRAERASLDLPAAMSREIQAIRHRSVGRHLLARRTVSAAAAALPRRHVVLKGPVLTSHHGDPGARLYSDVDVLVDRRSFAAALDGLADIGFRPLMTNWSGFLRHGVAEVPLGHPSGLLDVDLHFHTVGLARDRRTLGVDVGGILDRAVEMDLGDSRVTTADPVDTLLHLCVNLGLDGARGLRGLLDIDAVLHAVTLDPTVVVERARSTRVQALAAAVLQRCAQVLHTRGAMDLAQRLSAPPGWLAANRVADRTRQSGRSSRGLVPGWLLATGRRRGIDTLVELGRVVGTELRQRRGDVGLTQPGGELDWQGGDDSRESFKAYLEWVGTPPEPVIERVRNGEVLHALLRHHQPRVTQLLSAARHPVSAGARTDRILVRDTDGGVVAAIVVQRVALAVAPAFVFLAEARMAPTVSRLLDQLGATTIAGFERDVEPLRTLGRRWLDEVRLTTAALGPGFAWEKPATVTRRATMADIDALLELRRASTPGHLPSLRLLRPVQEALIADLTLVLDDAQGQPIGYIARQGWTPQWDIWGHLEIHPEHRGEGHAWRILAAAVQTTRDRGAGGMTFVASTNPMPLPDDTVLPEAWIRVTPDAPRRFKGEPRLRRLLNSTRRSVTAGPGVPIYRRGGRDDHLVTKRRTQQMWAAGDDQE